ARKALSIDCNLHLTGREVRDQGFEGTDVAVQFLLRVIKLDVVFVINLIQYGHQAAKDAQPDALKESDFAFRPARHADIESPSPCRRPAGNQLWRRLGDAQ